VASFVFRENEDFSWIWIWIAAAAGGCLGDDVPVAAGCQVGDDVILIPGQLSTGESDPILFSLSPLDFSQFPIHDQSCGSNCLDCLLEWPFQ